MHEIKRVFVNLIGLIGTAVQRGDAFEHAGVLLAYLLVIALVLVGKAVTSIAGVCCIE